MWTKLMGGPRKKAPKTIAVIDPDLFTYKEMRIEVASNGRSAGKTSTVFFGGHKVRVATGVDKEAFAELLLKILAAK